MGISAPGVAQSVLIPNGHVVVNSLHSVLLTGPRPAVILQDLLRPVTGGSVVTLLLSFANAGTHVLKVPVMPMAQFYSTLSPAPATPPTPTAATAGPPARHPGKHRTPTPTPSALP